jgi:hypothetical protein
MSSLVQAKWRKPALGASSGSAAMRSASQYSTGVGLAEALDQPAQEGERLGTERPQLGEAGFGEADEPLHLDLHPAADQAVFGEQRPERLDLAGITTVER